MSPLPTFSRAVIDAAWRDAQAVWDVRVNLSPPEELGGLLGEPGSAPAEPRKDNPLAYIDLEIRQVRVDFAQLVRIGAAASLPAVLAHEIGHHVRWPHTLGTSAALRIVEQRMIPGLGESLTNLFFDLLVNEVVGRTRADEICAVYQGFNRELGEGADGKTSALFGFYVAIYEELYGKPPGTLVTPATAADLDARFPGWRAEARMFAQTFYALPDLYLQFVYFLSRFARYLDDPTTPRGRFPLSGDVPEPDADDWDGALAGGDWSEDALAEAESRGWIPKGSARKAKAAGADRLAAIDKIASGRPGNERAAFKRRLVGKLYKRLVDGHLVTLPATAREAPEPFLPTTMTDWDAGDPLSAIDWTQSVFALGPLAAAAPLRRELEPDLPSQSEVTVPAVEIYLDTSGSMPDPQRALNAMTLAAQILSASALRKKGKVRGVIYSVEWIGSDWMYDEAVAREWFLNYSGGGTLFPFARCAELSAERADVLRVVISDGDFLHNLMHVEGGRALLAGAVALSRRFVAMLAWRDEKVAREALGELVKLPAFRLVLVKNLADFGPLAAQLSRALLG